MPPLGQSNHIFYWKGEFFLQGGGNLSRSDFGHSNLFQS